MDTSVRTCVLVMLAGLMVHYTYRCNQMMKAASVSRPQPSAPQQTLSRRSSHVHVKQPQIRESLI